MWKMGYENEGKPRDAFYSREQRDKGHLMMNRADIITVQRVTSL